jgi:hypothetical protein
VGTLTSAGDLPGYGPAALAYLKTLAAEPGTAVTVAGADAAPVAGAVVELPFMN